MGCVVAGAPATVEAALDGLAWVEPEETSAAPEGGDADETTPDGPAGDATSPATGAAGDWTPPDPSLPAGERAKRWWLRAQALGQAGQLRESAVAYRQSYDAKPTPAALYNVALALDLSGQPLDAIVAYERYLGEPGVDPDEKVSVEDRISELEGEVATLVVAGPEDGRFVVEVDGAPLEPTPGGIRLLPGPHDVVYVRDGVRRTVRVLLVAGAREVVTFGAEEEERDTDPLIEGPEDVTDGGDALRDDPRLRSRRRAVRTGAWVALGGTAAAGVALLGTGIGTLQAKREFEAASCGGPCPDGTVYDPAIEARFGRLRTASNVLVAVTAVGAVTTTALFIAGWSGGGDAGADEVAAGHGGVRRSAQRARVSLGVGGLRF